MDHRLPATFACIVSVAGTAARPAAAQGSPAVEPRQALVVLLSRHTAFSTLRPGRSPVTTIRATRPVTGAQTVLPVLRRGRTVDGARWLRVMLPGRPNGLEGWIKTRGTTPADTRWHVVVRTSSRRVLVYRRGAVVRTFAAIVGKPSTPTPRGRYFVEESVRMLPGSAGAPFALALSARSNVLQEFAGGPGQIAIHGMANLAGTPGTAVSHGCVRLAGRDIRWLARRIAAGVPVTIAR